MGDQHIEERIRKTLKREPQPELSPFFAARVANIAKAEQAERQAARRRLHPVLAVYWSVLLVASIWWMGASLQSDLAYYLLLALVPAGFAVAVFRRRMLDHVGSLMGRFFGQSAG